MGSKPEEGKAGARVMLGEGLPEVAGKRPEAAELLAELPLRWLNRL